MLLHYYYCNKTIKSIIYLLLCLSYGLSYSPLAWGQWNNPHRFSAQDNIYYSVFENSPKTLDPARAYSADELIFLAQIYEPPLQYHYLKRPYALEPLSSIALPTVSYYDQQGHILNAMTAPALIAKTTYDIYIKPGIYYQPHPAFARDAKGNFYYQHLQPKKLEAIHSLQDFAHMGTRELTADDFVYAIKRLADPEVASPIYGLMSRYILGLSDFQNSIETHYHTKLHAADGDTGFIDLRPLTLAGAQTISRYHYRITLKGFYPQFKYWLTMPFFAPIPWEAAAFYAQRNMAQHDITFDEYPVGTGPYLLAKNNPNEAIILTRNPNFHGEVFPTATRGDYQQSYMLDAGKPLPFIDTFVFSLDKESIPRWQKFLQGYYDRSTILPEGFEQAIQLDALGQPVLTRKMRAQGIYLNTTVIPALYYIGFNMQDPVVGGYTDSARQLRQAIAIALNYEEYSDIFLNGRGIPAQGPLPPGIFGYEKGKQGMNPYVYNWVNGRVQRKPISVAKNLMTAAGYPGGRDIKTGKPLVLNFDTPTSGGPDEAANFNWLRKQFAKLGIELNIRATLYNRFQDKMLHGNAQIFSWGWSADYPDPENFLFLFYSQNGMAQYGGENNTNYANPTVDTLFRAMAQLPNGALRKQKIDQLVEILRKDGPCVWGYYPISFTLSQQWLQPIKPSGIANNVLKYYRINPQLRARLLKQWNQPIVWPLILVGLFIVLLLLPLLVTYYLRQHRPTIKRYK